MKSAKKRRHEEKSKERLRKKIMKKMKEKEARSVDAKDKSNGHINEPKLYIKRSIKKILDKYATNYKLTKEWQGTILDKAFDKVFKDWGSKDRKLSVKKWMNTEKRRKSVKGLVSKYSKKYAKKK